MNIDALRRSTLADTKPTLVDSLMAVGLTALVWLQLALPPLAINGGPPIHRPQFEHFARMRHFVPTPWAFALVALCFLPLALRRRFPLGVLAVVTVASAIYSWLPHPPALTIIAVLVALYTVGTRYPRGRLAFATVGAMVVTLPASLPGFGTTFWVAEVVRIAALLVAAALLGDATRNQRAYVAEVERRALEAERTREEEARRRVDEERLRIARELHDITAHSLSIVAVQSGMARHVIHDDPEQATKALEAISETSRSALKELRSVIGVLRGVDQEGDVPLAPAPSLSRLAELTGPLEEAGLKVETAVEGDVSSLPSLVDASAYRIVQEALTNVMRHAGASKANIKVVVGPDDVRVVVTDDGRGAPEPPAVEGHGIAGMRERALALGGTFEAGPAAPTGFEVRASLPLKGGAP